MARYESGERKKIGNKVLAPLNQQIMTVLPMMPLPNGATNISTIPVASGVKFIGIPKDSELFPIGSLVSASTSSNNSDYIPISTSTTNLISTQNFPLLEPILANNYSSSSYTALGYLYQSATSKRCYVFIAGSKYLIFVTGTATVAVFNDTEFPSNPTNKTLPFTLNEGDYVFIEGAYGNGFLSVLESNTNRGIVSSDLNTFTQFTFPVTNQGHVQMIFNGTVFCVTTSVSSVSYLYTSSNGQTYTQRNNFGNLGRIYLASSPNGLIVAVPNSGTKVFISSDNGVNLVEYVLPVSNTWLGVTWDIVNNQFILIGVNYTLTSSDGVSWIAYGYNSISYSPTNVVSTTKGIAFGLNGNNYNSGNVWMGKAPCLYTVLDDVWPIHHLQSNGNILLYARRYVANSYGWLDVRKLVFSETELKQPAITSSAGTQYFLRGK